MLTTRRCLGREFFRASLTSEFNNTMGVWREEEAVVMGGSAAVVVGGQCLFGAWLQRVVAAFSATRS